MHISTSNGYYLAIRHRAISDLANNLNTFHASFCNLWISRCEPGRVCRVHTPSLSESISYTGLAGAEGPEFAGAVTAWGRRGLYGVTSVQKQGTRWEVGRGIKELGRPTKAPRTKDVPQGGERERRHGFKPWMVHRVQYYNLWSTKRKHANTMNHHVYGLLFPRRTGSEQQWQGDCDSVGVFWDLSTTLFIWLAWPWLLIMQYTRQNFSNCCASLKEHALVRTRFHSDWLSANIRSSLPHRKERKQSYLQHC